MEIISANNNLRFVVKNKEEIHLFILYFSGQWYFSGQGLYHHIRYLPKSESDWKLPLKVCRIVKELRFVPVSSTRGLLPCGSVGKESACNAGYAGLIPGSEDLLEKEMATHSSIFAWETPWTEKPGRLQSMGLDVTERLSYHYHHYFPGG